MPPLDCVYLYISVCVCLPHGTVLLPYFVSQGKAGSGLLVLSRPSFSPLEVILKAKPPDGAEFDLKEPLLLNIYARVFILCLSLFITCCRRVGPRRQKLI